jgi:hypothetical protein
MKGDRQLLARRLVRLYPRLWRERYETEMLALIEDTGLNWRRGANVLYGAGREWYSVLLRRPAEFSHWSMVLGLVIAAAAISAAGTLTELSLARFGFVPSMWQVQTSLGGVLPALQFLLIGRGWLSGVMRPYGLGGTNWKAGPTEVRWWLAALFVGSVCWQWSQMAGDAGASHASSPLLRSWGSSAFQVFVQMSILRMSTQSYSEHLQRLRDAATARARADVPRNPIGLS